MFHRLLPGTLLPQHRSLILWERQPRIRIGTLFGSSKQEFPTESSDVLRAWPVNNHQPTNRLRAERYSNAPTIIRGNKSKDVSRFSAARRVKGESLDHETFSNANSPGQTSPQHPVEVWLRVFVLEKFS